MLYELALMKIPMCLHISYILSLFQKILAAFNGVYNFNSWDISHEFMTVFMKYGGSNDNKKLRNRERNL